MAEVPLNETPEEKQKRIDAANRFQSYMRGWKDGASMHAMPKEFRNHSDAALSAAYDLGYAHGYEARGEAQKNAEERYGYTPSILRLAAEG